MRTLCRPTIGDQTTGYGTVWTLETLSSEFHRGQLTFTEIGVWVDDRKFFPWQNVRSVVFD